MENLMSQILFLSLSTLFLIGIAYRILHIRKAIRLGKNWNPPPGTKKQRLYQTLLLALGQKKMFQKPLPALLHLLMYLGFWLINLEILEIFIDGSTGSHRIFFPYMKTFYPVLISFLEVLALSVLIASIIFLARRNIFPVRRLQHPDLKGFPKTDAHLILLAEIGLMIAFLCMNTTDQLLQERGLYVNTGDFLISQWMMPWLDPLPTQSLYQIERLAWWGHWIGILGFALYISYSKHLHIFMAFPNTYYTPIQVPAKWENMEAIQQELSKTLGDQDVPAQDSQESMPSTFGAQKIQDLNWKNLMDAYSCTECGRCTEECPASLTGKRLSPRLIMMKTRDCAEDVLAQKGKGILLDQYISREEINACTTCMACVQACPVSINPMNIIVQLRQYAMMEESKAPTAWNEAASNIEINQSPWKFPHDTRTDWATENTP
ncbi:MAG: (Fe-S)-binding protein [Cytophagales bacterium]|nr:(Fe-S)-binding protein [Cytophagales bacterium]